MAPSKFAKDCLEAHNDKRKLHGVSKLKLNSELCALAENWALTLLRYTLFPILAVLLVICDTRMRLELRDEAELALFLTQPIP